MSRPPGKNRDWQSIFGLGPFLVGLAVELGWMVRNSLARASMPPGQQAERRERAHQLCHAVLGNDKSAIAAVFGPPHASAGFATVAPAMLVSTDYQHAETWYYPLDRKGRTALAVRFDRGIAQEAHLVNFHAD